MTWRNLKAQGNMQKGSWNDGETKWRIRVCESAGARENIYHDSEVKLGGDESEHFNMSVCSGRCLMQKLDPPKIAKTLALKNCEK